MPRRGENIRKRKDNRWEGRYIMYYDENEKAKYGSVYGKTYLETKKRLTAIFAQLAANKPIANSSCRKWMQRFKQTEQETPERVLSYVTKNTAYR